jgi:hypothetical protein
MRISTLIGGRWESLSGVTDDTSSAACEVDSSAMVVSDNVIGISSSMILDPSLCSNGRPWISES